MNANGSCPRCDRILEAAPDSGPPRQLASASYLDLKKLAAGPGQEELSAPWHFKLLVVGLVVYLGWRIVAIFI